MSNSNTSTVSTSTPTVVVVTKSWGTYEDHTTATAAVFVGDDAFARAAKFVQINGEEEARIDGMWDAFEKMVDGWEKKSKCPLDDKEREAWYAARTEYVEGIAKTMGLDLNNRYREHERLYYKIESGYAVNPDPYDTAK